MICCSGVCIKSIILKLDKLDKHYRAVAVAAAFPNTIYRKEVELNDKYGICNKCDKMV